MDFPFPDGSDNGDPVDLSVSATKAAAPDLEDFLAPLLRMRKDETPILGGTLPALVDMLTYFGGATPMPSLHGLSEDQSKAALLQLCGCPDKHIAGIIGVDSSTVRTWTSIPGWRNFQRDVLDHSLQRLIGLAHITLVQTFLHTEDERERVKLAKWIIETSGVHEKSNKHVHRHEHSMITQPRPLESTGTIVTLPPTDDETDMGGL